MAENVCTAGNQTHGALNDRREKHNVVAVVNGKVGVDLLGREEEVGDLSGVDAGLVLDADDVVDRRKARNGGSLKVHADEYGDVVQKNIDLRDCLGNCLEVQVQAFLSGLVVERADDEAGLDAEFCRFLGQGDGLLGGGAAGAGNDGLGLGSFDRGLHELYALVKGQQGSFAGGAGNDEAVAEIVLLKVVYQLCIGAVADVLVIVIGSDEGQKDLAVFCNKLVHFEFLLLSNSVFLPCLLRILFV